MSRRFRVFPTPSSLLDLVESRHGVLLSSQRQYWSVETAAYTCHGLYSEEQAKRVAQELLAHRLNIYS